MKKRTQITGIIFSLAIVLSSSANAKNNKKDPLEGVKSPLSGLYSCADVTEPTERLSCYDKTVASLQIAEDKEEIITIDATVAKKIKKEAFGFNLPSLPKLGLPQFGPDTKPDALVMKVKSIRKPLRKYVIILENGQVWQEVGGHLNYVPKGTLTATIKPKSMGSFSLSLNNGKTTVKGLRIKRIE